MQAMRAGHVMTTTHRQDGAGGVLGHWQQHAGVDGVGDPLRLDVLAPSDHAVRLQHATQWVVAAVV